MYGAIVGDIVMGYRIDDLSPVECARVIEEFDIRCSLRAEAFDKMDGCAPIPL